MHKEMNKCHVASLRVIIKSNLKLVLKVLSRKHKLMLLTSSTL